MKLSGEPDFFAQYSPVSCVRYYDGKLFIYDWVRDWIRVVTMRPDGEFSKMESFMDETTFNPIMDMEPDPNRHLSLLEYGKGWLSKNPDLLPFDILFTADDPMTYTWTLSTGEEIETDKRRLEYTFDEVGGLPSFS